MIRDAAIYLDRGPAFNFRGQGDMVRRSYLGLSGDSMRSAAFSVTESEFQSAMRLFLWSRRLSAKSLALGLITPAIAAVAVFIYGQSRNQPAAILGAGAAFVVAVVITLVCEVISAWLHARATARNPLHTLENTFHWARDGFTLQSSKGDSKLQWSDLYGYALNKKVLLLFISSSLFIPIPWRALTAQQIADLKGTIDTAGVPNWARWH